MSKLKEQTLFSASTIDNKDLFWISKYISGTEGATGVYQTFRLTASQLRALLYPSYSTTFTPTTVTANNIITHNLGTRNILVNCYDVANGYSQMVCSIELKTVDTIVIVFNENPSGDVLIVISTI